MNNFKQPGNALEFTAPEGDVVSGMAYLIGTLLVVATNNATAGDKFRGTRTGVFALPKATGETWDEGELLYWDDAAHKLTTTAEDNTPVGCAAAAALIADASGVALLTGVPAEPVVLGT